LPYRFTSSSQNEYRRVFERGLLAGCLQLQIKREQRLNRQGIKPFCRHNEHRIHARIVFVSVPCLSHKIRSRRDSVQVGISQLGLDVFLEQRHGSRS
jgi:hypothetical protein